MNPNRSRLPNRARCWRAVLAAAVLVAGLASATAADVAVVHQGTVHDALYAIALDGPNGLAAGAPGLLLETADGGAHWRSVPGLPTRLPLLGVALRGEHALAVGQQGTVLRRDRGRWRTVDAGTGERLLAVALGPDAQALAVGAFGTIRHSSDGGERWTSASPDWSALVEGGAEPHLYAAHVGTDGTLTVAGEFGLILQRPPGSAAWVRRHAGDASLFALTLDADGHGEAVGQDGTRLRSRDGGQHWQAQPSGTTAILLGVASGPGDALFLSGMRTLRHSPDGGRRWIAIDGGDSGAQWLQGLARPDPASARVLAVGHGATILSITP